MYGKQIKKTANAFINLDQELLRYGMVLKCITDTSGCNKGGAKTLNVLVQLSDELNSIKSREVVKAIKATEDWQGYTVTITFTAYISGGKWLIEED